ncbi:MAG: rhodanese-like domain-containing protein [Cyanobacteria bacterium K_Offshore_surface_m2_239]|nr:rhodanese-like domain-containing protein [Cyanobacteria bacterium K_Offshore_surface_m2_239]
MHHDEAFLRRAAEAKARVVGLVPEDLEPQLERGAILIDVREPDEIKSGTIRNAHNIPLDGLLQKIEATVPDRSARIVCFCRGGNRGALAAAALLDQGYSNVKTLARGLEGVPDRLLEPPE